MVPREDTGISGWQINYSHCCWSPPGSAEDRQHVLSSVIQLFFRMNQKLGSFSELSAAPGLVVPAGTMSSWRVCWQQELQPGCPGHMLGASSCATAELPRFSLLLVCPRHWAGSILRRNMECLLRSRSSRGCWSRGRAGVEEVSQQLDPQGAE